MTPGDAPQRRSTVVWRFSDGKPGHDNQSRGLVHALAQRLPLQTFDIALAARRTRWLDWPLRRCRNGAGLPTPDLLVGAGHATHAALLACRRARGGRSVVMMRPSLPLACFDLCVIPSGPHVFVTRGALNTVQPGPATREGYGLVLVGGPSSHYDWQLPPLLAQIEQILTSDARAWRIVTSRRTPAATEQAMRELAERTGHRLVLPGDTDRAWLPGQMAGAAVVWITEDSVSMLYEALTSGAACGVLAVPTRRQGRVQAGVQQLIGQGIVTPFQAWRQGQALRPPVPPLDEAGRCAEYIVQRWFAR